MLAKLFAGFGADEAAAQEYADRISDGAPVLRRVPPMTRTHSTAPRDWAILRGSRCSPMSTNSPLLSASLRQLVDRALPFVTVFNGSSDVDPQIAAPEVIAALPGKTPANPNDVLGQQPPSSNNAPVATADSSGPAQSNATTAKSSAYRIETTINFNDGRRSASEVVIAIGDKDKEDPYRVLSWHDDLEPRVVLRKRTGL